MAEKRKQSGFLNLVLSNLDTVAALMKYAIPASFAGVAAGWATWVAGVLQQYAPASWMFAAILGGLCGALIMALLAYAIEKWQAIRFRNMAFNASRINPLDALFESQRLRIHDLSPPYGAIIENKNFIDCDILGPANVVFENCHFSSNQGEIVDALIIKPGMQPKNGFGFRNCMFRGCRFYYVTFMIPEPEYGSFCSPNHYGLNWITEIPDQPLLPIN
jgi:hypothetical protein